MQTHLDSLIRGTVEDLPSRINLGELLTAENFAQEKETIWRSIYTNEVSK